MTENLHQNVASNTPVPRDIHDPPKNIPLQSLSQRYQVISNLGNGSFGSVSLAKFRGDTNSFLENGFHKIGTLMDPIVDSQANRSSLVAIKTMNKRLNSLKDYTTVKEILFILAIPAHPNLIQIYEIFIDDSAFQLHISMECMNQNLYQLMKARKNIHFSPTTLRSILTQILSGIRHIHRYSYFHRDIKPENILVIPTNAFYGDRSLVPPHRRNDNYTIKIADYGLARHVQNTKIYTAYVSTRWYRSPEILLRRKFYSRPVDIWAFGTVAVEVATFRPLFPGSNELDQTWKILETLGSPSVTDISNYPNPIYDMPLGGFWEEAQVLSSKLGFHLPYTQGTQMNKLLPKPEHALLCDVVKACLTWDPDARADVEFLCSMPYFKDTIVSRPYEEPRKLHPTKQTPSSEDLQSVSQMLAGISTKSNIVKQNFNLGIAPISTTNNYKSAPFLFRTSDIISHNPSNVGTYEQTSTRGPNNEHINLYTSDNSVMAISTNTATYTKHQISESNVQFKQKNGNDENCDQQSTYGVKKISNENEDFVDMFQSQHPNQQHDSEICKDLLHYDRAIHDLVYNTNVDGINGQGNFSNQKYKSNEIIFNEKAGNDSEDVLNMYDLLTDYQIDGYEEEKPYDEDLFRLEDAPPELAGNSNDDDIDADSPKTDYHNHHDQNYHLNINENTMYSEKKMSDNGHNMNAYINYNGVNENSDPPNYNWSNSPERMEQDFPNEENNKGFINADFSFDILKEAKETEIALDEGFNHDVSFTSTEGIKC